MSDVTSDARKSPYAVFRNRDFTYLFAGQTVSDFGNGITSIAASVIVYRETGSALSVGLMLMATALPGFFLGLIAGVFVDRWNRKAILIVAEILRTIIILLIPVLLPQGIWWLYILVMLNSTITQFFDPAHASVLPDVASNEELAAANSLLSVAHTGALGLGFAVAGFITANYPVEYAFWIDAATFLLSGVLVAFVRVPKLEVTETSDVGAVVQNLRDGATFLWDSPVLRSAFLSLLPIGLLFGLHNSMLLPFATRALDATEADFGLMEGVAMVGFVVGGFILTSLADRLREGQWIALSYMGMGAATIVYSQLQSVELAIVVGVFSAFFNVPSFVARRLLIQRNTTREVRGRVTSAFFVTRDFTFIIGMALAGLADIFDVRLLYLIEGIALLVVGLIVTTLPGLRQPAKEWRRSISMLRSISEAEMMEMGRPVTLADIDQYATQLPVLAAMSKQQRQVIVSDMRLCVATEGTAIVRRGEASDAAYFIVEGQAVAGWHDAGRERVLEVMNAGDFFGEIAALTGVPRAADVVARNRVTMLRVSADTLRNMAADPNLNRIFYSRMMERMMTSNMLDVPRGPSHCMPTGEFPLVKPQEMEVVSG